MTTEEQNNGIPPEMVETSDLPNDGALRDAYDAMRLREPETAGSSEKTAEPMKISCHSCGQKLDLSTLPAFSTVICPTCGTELIVPKWFDNYLLEQLCGTGGMATVYRALDVALDREVAIKVLNGDYSNQQEHSELFLHEARTAATINHYAVIPIYTCGIFEHQTYIVMQYMGGGSLESLLENTAEPLPLPHVISWIRDVAAGLENAWQHGIIHHDVKPANIMLDQDGKAKIGDFGIAQVINSGGSNPAENAAQAWVSPHYVSPEKLLTGQDDYRGDIYSLGASFYHLVTGTPPFNSDDLDELLRMRVNEDPASPALYRANLPEGLVQLIMAMLSRDPDQRPGYAQIIKTLNTLLNRPAGTARKHKPAPSAVPRRSSAPRPPLQKKKTPAGIVCLKLFSHLFSLAVLLGGTIFVLDKYDRLNAFVDYLPKFMQEKKKPLEAEKRLNTQLINCFQSGDPEAVVAEGKAVMRRDGYGKRYQAALQVMYAAYLVNDPQKTADKYGRAIHASLQASIKPIDKIVFEDTLLLLRYLSGEIDYEMIDLETKFKHAMDYPAKLALAELLIRLQNEPEMNQKTRLDLLDSFQAELEKLEAVSCWLNDAFTDRLPYWRQVLKDGTGIIDEIEPLFRPLIKEEAKWTFTEPKKLWKKQGNTMTASSAGEQASGESSKPAVIISTMRVKDGQAKFQKLSRPQHKTPMEFFNSAPRLRRYIESIDSDDKKLTELEKRILTRMQEIRIHMVQVTEAENGGGLPIEELTWEQKRNELELDEGTLVFTERNIQYTPKGGKEEDTVLLSWFDLKADTLKDFLKRLAEHRCGRPAASLEKVGSIGVAKDSRERANIWLDLAYVASWYNDTETLEEALKNVVTETKDPDIIGQVTGIFLKVMDE